MYLFLGMTFVGLINISLPTLCNADDSLANLALGQKRIYSVTLYTKASFFDV